MHHTLITLCLIMLAGLGLPAQTGRIVGTISSSEGPAAYAKVSTAGVTALTDEAGQYVLADLPANTYVLEVSQPGYRRAYREVVLAAAEERTQDFSLIADWLQLEDVVITGTRHEVPQYDSPVIVSQISNRTFEATQSLSVSEGLSFSPGLRVETNCQNCGFTQVRMNGLEGAYSQILINSRPVFSALAGVYGLDMIPANMIDRVEVVRGGGSALYGGNAIAGTINIITKDPVQNRFELGLNQSLINLEASDRTLSFNGSVVDDALTHGASFYGYHRSRTPWDANGDDFSEITQLENTTVGLDAFWNLGPRRQLRLNAYAIDEFRRGGNGFDLAPHQADLTEQLDHRILGGGLSYEYYSADYQHKLSLYTSGQTVSRDSYYGGGGRVLGPRDTLTADDILAINAYGRSQDLSLATGLQYAYHPTEALLLMAGTEHQYNTVEDQMPGYDRQINQTVGTLGTYVQAEWQPLDRLSLLAGGRYDYIDLDGRYKLGENILTNESTLGVFVPRATLMYNLGAAWTLRTAVAQGYRAPQAFDEDLHIETVGGAARFIRLAPDLETERSNSATLSLTYSRAWEKFQVNIVAEGFHTRLQNPFILSGQVELPSGAAVITKRNGEGARVEGINLEANLAYGGTWRLQGGATLQRARYDVPEELWASDIPNDPTPATFTERLLRTPNAYGFFTLSYTPTKAWHLSYSGVITGPMEVPYVMDPETERTIIRETPAFFEQNLKLAYTFFPAGGYRLVLSAGVQNLLNQYQEDFDRGPARDAGYIYGPNRPRTAFVGLRIGWQ